MPANVVVVSTPEDRAARLQRFNLREEHLRNAIIAGDDARETCTSNHPTLYRSSRFWGESTRSLRDQLATFGYVPDERAGFATCFNRELGIAIVVAAGDLATGLDEDGLSPKSKYRKGTGTLSAVKQNQLQLELFPGMVVDVQEDPGEPNGRVTWFLLVNKDLTANELRAELSLPAGLTEDAKVTGWVERIILEPIPCGGVAPPIPEPSPIDVPVERLPTDES